MLSTTKVCVCVCELAYSFSHVVKHFTPPPTHTGHEIITGVGDLKHCVPLENTVNRYYCPLPATYLGTKCQSGSSFPRSLGLAREGGQVVRRLLGWVGPDSSGGGHPDALFDEPRTLGYSL